MKNIPEDWNEQRKHKKQSSSIQISNVELVAPILWYTNEKMSDFQYRAF